MTIASVMKKKTTNQLKIEQEEEELKKLLNPPEEKEGKENKEEQILSAEEKLFKKRYGDLRRHAQKKEEELSKELESLKKKLEKAQERAVLPEEKEKVMAWAKEHPDFARIVHTLSKDATEGQIQEKAEDLEKRMEELEARSRQVTLAELETQIRSVHSDYDTLKETDEFYTWAEGQPKWIQDVLFENDSDAKSVIRVIDLYKADTKAEEPKKKNTSTAKDAALAVTSKSKAEVDPQGQRKLIYESEIAKMTDKQYAANADKIDKAIREGNLVYDLSVKKT